jgi:hypothetical protein
VAKNNRVGLSGIEVFFVEKRRVGITMNPQRKVWHLRRFRFPSESPIRDYVWGLVIVAFGVLTILGMFFLFGG